MADRSRIDDAAVTDVVIEVVDRLSDRLADASSVVQKTLELEIGELRGDPQLLDLLHASVEGNVATVLNAIHHGIPIERVETPAAALEYARRLAQRGVPASALVRAYRIGHRVVLDLIVEGVQQVDADPGLGLDVVGRIAAISFRYIDWISQQVVEVYEAERDRWLENRSRVRDVRIAEILDGGDVDVDAMINAIRYPLRKVHLALIVWFSDDVNFGNEFVRQERFLDELAEHMEAGNALFAAADRVSGWGWIPLEGHTTDAVERVRQFVESRDEAPYVALGEALPGVDGFRRSHRQAQNARCVAVAAASSTPRVTAFSDRGLAAAALMGSDIGEARVWVGEVLGPLATDSDNDAILRDTLALFLRERGSYKAAAEQLHLHFNSVKYRIQRAIQRRGRPIGDDRLDVELALLVCQRFGAAVLRSERP
jgi:DNA-binding PucR family transcriptional regulator